MFCKRKNFTKNMKPQWSNMHPDASVRPGYYLLFFFFTFLIFIRYHYDHHIKSFFLATA